MYCKYIFIFFILHIINVQSKHDQHGNRHDLHNREFDLDNEREHDFDHEHSDLEDERHVPEYKNGHSDHSSCKEKRNVVMFFAHSSKSSCSTGEENFLGMEERTRLKHSVSGENSKLASLKFGRNNRNIPNCNELLESSLKSLINYCKNALGMATAMVDVENDSYVEQIETKDASLESEGHFIHDLIRVAPDEREINPEEDMKRSSHLHNEANEKYRQYVYNLRQSTEDFKKNHNIQKFNIDGSKKGDLYKNVETGPKHTESFNLRNKRNNVIHPNMNKIVDIPLTKRNSKHFWNLFDFMADKSFLGKMLQDQSDEPVDKEEDRVSPDNLGHIKDTALFDLVKQTLANVQENTDNGFLLIVVGGKMADLHDDHSSLQQSIKLICESTEPDSTLFIVTGACPDDKDVKIEEKGNDLIPLYSKGPGSEELSQCTELYDVPLTVKKILARNRLNIDGNENFKDLGKENKMLPVRRKRNLFGDVPSNKDKSQYNSGTEIIKLNWVWYLLACILFII